MFDIGFFELCLVFVVALLVVGPERLPGVVRSIGQWIGKARNIAQSVKSEIEREVINQDILNSDAHKVYLAEAEEFKKTLEETLLENASNESGHGEYEPIPNEPEPPTESHPKDSTPSVDDPQSK